MNIISELEEAMKPRKLNLDKTDLQLWIDSVTKNNYVTFDSVTGIVYHNLAEE